MTAAEWDATWAALEALLPKYDARDIAVAMAHNYGGRPDEVPGIRVHQWTVTRNAKGELQAHTEHHCMPMVFPTALQMAYFLHVHDNAFVLRLIKLQEQLEPARWMVKYQDGTTASYLKREKAEDEKQAASSTNNPAVSIVPLYELTLEASK